MYASKVGQTGERADRAFLGNIPPGLSHPALINAAVLLNPAHPRAEN